MAPLIPLVVQAVITAAVTTAASFAVRALTQTSARRAAQQAVRSVQPIETPPNALAVRSEPGGPCYGVFGHRRVGGRIILEYKAGVKTYIIVALANRPVTSVNAIYVNNALAPLDASGNVTAAPWQGMNVALYDGTQTTADAALVADIPGWTGAHVGQQVAYARITVDPTGTSAFDAGVPDFTFDIQGFGVYDPRDPAQSELNTATWQYSENAALIEAGYLVHPLGRALSPSQVDWPAYAAAADICDQIVALAEGGGEARYGCCAYWSTDERHERVLSRIGACHATEGPVRQGRRYAPSTRNPLTGGASTPVTPADYEGSGLALADTAPISEAVNAVRGKFTSPLFNYEPRDFPGYVDAVAVAEDGGSTYWLDLDLPFVSSHTQAQRLARIAYNKVRKGHDAKLDLNFGFFDNIAGDLLLLSDPLVGSTALPYRIKKDRTGSDYVCTFELELELDTFFAWDVADENATEPVVSLGSVAGGSALTTELRFAGGALYDAPPLTAPGGVGALRVEIYPAPTEGLLLYKYIELLPTGQYAVRADFGDLSGGNLIDISGVTFSGPTATRMLIEVRNPATGQYLRQSLKAFDPGGSGTPLDVSYLAGRSEAATQFFCLPSPPRPSLQSTSGGSAIIEISAAPPSPRIATIELLEASTSSASASTVVAVVANANTTVTRSAPAGSARYYWTRCRSTDIFGTTKLGPVSQATLVVFG